MGEFEREAFGDPREPDHSSEDAAELEELRREAAILREQLDGAAKIATDNLNLPKRDAAWWENYRGRVEQAARAAEPDKP